MTKEMKLELSNGREENEPEVMMTRSISSIDSAYSDSSLVKYTCLSPNCNSPRNHVIDTITIHEVWGELTMRALGEIFAPVSRQASSNYGVCTDGIALFVHERDRAWTSGSWSNDNRAVTIEVSNSRTYPNPVSDPVYANLIKLCADICKRNGKTKMVWCGSLSATNSRTFAPNEMRMTLHKWFQATDCPGAWLEAHMADIAKQVNSLLAPRVYPKLPFSVNVLIKDLYIRLGAGTDYKTNGYVSKGNHIITEVKNDFGKLDNGKGWIYLGEDDYVKIGGHIEVSPYKDVKPSDDGYYWIKKVTDAGLMGGINGKFKPNGKVTRKQLATVLGKLLEKQGK